MSFDNEMQAGYVKSILDDNNIICSIFNTHSNLLVKFPQIIKIDLMVKPDDKENALKILSEYNISYDKTTLQGSIPDKNSKEHLIGNEYQFNDKSNNSVNAISVNFKKIVFISASIVLIVILIILFTKYDSIKKSYLFGHMEHTYNKSLDCYNKEKYLDAIKNATESKEYLSKLYTGHIISFDDYIVWNNFIAFQLINCNLAITNTNVISKYFNDIYQSNAFLPNFNYYKAYYYSVIGNTNKSFEYLRATKYPTNDADGYYNTAWLSARNGNGKLAYNYLQLAIQYGFSDYTWYTNSKEFDVYRNNSDFKKLKWRR